MEEYNPLNEETLRIIREVDENPTLNQRFLSRRLNISLGKTNYLIKELAKKGIIEIVNFSTQPGKAKKLKYILTKKGIEHKMDLTHHFLQKKEMEYKKLKEEYDRYVLSRTIEK